MKQFEQSTVWFRRKNRTGIVAYEDVGKLCFSEGCVVFEGHKMNIQIEKISSVSIGRVSSWDIMNKWVRVIDQNEECSYFADGRLFGWRGLFGGTKKIFDQLKLLIEAAQAKGSQPNGR